MKSHVRAAYVLLFSLKPNQSIQSDKCIKEDGNSLSKSILIHDTLIRQRKFCVIYTRRRHNWWFWYKDREKIVWFSTYTVMPSTSANNTSDLEFTLTDTEVAILCAVNVVFSIVGTLGNLLVCFAFLRFPKLRNNMNIFILSLACSALLVCMLAQPMYVVSLALHYQQKHIMNVFEKVRKGITWISLQASAGNLFGVTLDRYHAITKPFRHSEQQVVGAHALVFVSVIWVIAMGLGTCAIFKDIVKMVVLVYVFVIMVCFTLPLYARILLIAAKHRQKILASQTCTSNLSMRNESNPPSPMQRYRLKLRHKIDRSALVTVGVICVVFVLGWFPLLILAPVYRIFEEDKKLILDVFQWVNTIALCSSACNPIVYAATDKRFRESLKVTHRRWVTRRQDFATSHGKLSRSSKRSNESSN